MKLLAADDDQGVLLALEFLVRGEGITFISAATPAATVSLARAQSPDLVLLDLNYTKDTTSGTEGMTLLSQLRSARPTRPIIVMTGWATIEGAVEAMRRGASDYIPKPWDNTRLVELLRRYDPARARSEPSDDLDRLAELSPAMGNVLNTIDQIAFSDVPVLITGEHGTGKEMIARRIHSRSSRPGAFVTVNAGALPDGTLESELFGHLRGAFTDAKTDRRGAFGEAHDGTIFLDEIANMPGSQQGKLLRVLQDGEFRPLGGGAVERLTARLISATNADLNHEIGQGRFRPDLLYRLNAIHLHLPPLRERREQIPILAERFATRTAARHGLTSPEIGPSVIGALCRHDWPGNVRELEHAMQRAVLLSAPSGRIQKEHLGLPSSEAAPAPLAPLGAGNTLKEAERTLILETLQRFPGDRLAAARSLGLTRSAFYRRLQQLRIKLDR